MTDIIQNADETNWVILITDGFLEVGVGQWLASERQMEIITSSRDDAVARAAVLGYVVPDEDTIREIDFHA
jgi:hypothetical protein